MRKIAVIWICSLLVLSFKPVRADDSALSGIAGGAVSPMEQHPSVRMVNEKVDIRLGKNGATVKCLFTFKNEGPACSVLMGFPERVWASGDASAFGRLQHFVSYVDGKKAIIDYRPAARNKEGYQYREDYTSWYVKKVKFARNQTRKVTDEYFCRYGSHAQVESTTLPAQFVTYVLKTGANWKGPIGTAVITVDATHAVSFMDIKPPAHSVKVGDKHWIWTAKNLEPKEDFQVDLYPRYPLLNGRLIGGGYWWPMEMNAGNLMVSTEFLTQLGGEVDVKKQTCTVQYGKHTLFMKNGDREAMLDSKPVMLSVPIWVRNNSDTCTMPLVSVVKLLGGKVSKDTKTGRLNVRLTDLHPKSEPNASP